ncbi:HGGxSTG domain-containing protein [Desulfococcus multivorans]|uniref:Uncharacterized protein n=1 Tax=Desulfococcus multivorans DSM 2059 TaxID=1121405 RepID=S7T613_DESML|nr:HGGxSTG domain-containing protein [Desulfococcus multivorans]AQV02572.1 hypothetical protein B2D07_18535 [Desulfococcus multivorans]EPR32497.1 hypothetical protein dsmv_0870 [Desulfococcus multivorans DSM 2059]SKA27767.1 hypothetical protein SAMN02745446_03729 [Desulfococcus multivorans DSM 2059]
MSTKSEDQPIICGAKTRSGALCQNPPELGRRRCRIHGGAKGSGAPQGNKNAWKHGFYSAEAIARRRDARRLVKESRELMSMMNQISGISA